MEEKHLLKNLQKKRKKAIDTCIPGCVLVAYRNPVEVKRFPYPKDKHSHTAVEAAGKKS